MGGGGDTMLECFSISQLLRMLGGSYKPQGLTEGSSMDGAKHSLDFVAYARPKPALQP